MVQRVCLFIFLYCVGGRMACAECRETRMGGVPCDAMPYVYGTDTTWWHVFAIRDSGEIDGMGTGHWEMLGQISRIFRRDGASQAVLNLTLALDTSFGNDATALVLHCGGLLDTVITRSRDENVAANPYTAQMREGTNETIHLYTFLLDITDDVDLLKSELRHATVVFDNGRSITSHHPHPEKLEAVMIPANPAPPEPPREWTPRRHRPGRSLLQ